MDGRSTWGLVRATFGAVACVLVMAAPALANAPNPGPTTIDQVVVNSNGSTTVTVQGSWTWASQTNCPTARNGVGYQVDWFDNQTNAIGSNNSPNGILYVGDAQDNIVHSVETLGGSSVLGNAFYDGVPSSYVSHISTSTTPSKTDASNWFSECDGTNSSGVTAGTWGPITHTYAATATPPLKLCPILYDPHGGHDNSGQSSVQDITAGKNAATNNYNNDNSYETNGTGPNGDICPAVTIPRLQTSATSTTLPSGSISDTATLSNAGGQSGSIIFKLYAEGANCTGTPLYTKTVATTGDGSYSSGSFAPGSAGTYQWQDQYSSATVKGLISSCNDTKEQSTVPGMPLPTLVTQVPSATASLGDGIFDRATLSGAISPTGTITWALYSDAACMDQVATATATVTGNGTYTGSPSYMVTSPGTYYWVASYSGDANNSPVSTNCGDPNEETTVPQNQPTLVTDATPSATSGDTIVDHATLSGGFSPTGTITWNLYLNGCTDLVDTVSATVTGDGTYVTSPGYTANDAGTYFWVASYSGDANNAPASTKCGDPDEETQVNSPGIQVLKLSSVPCSALPGKDISPKPSQPPGVLPCTGPFSRFTHGTITVEVPKAGGYSIPIDYEIQVTNSGSTTLALSLNDPLCDRRTVQGPFQVSGTLVGDTLSAGGSAYYTCTHLLTARDGDGRFSPFANTATVTGQPPSGPPVHGTSTVITNRVHPAPVRHPRVCLDLKTGRRIRWRRGTPKPKACRPQHGRPGKGFTG